MRGRQRLLGLALAGVAVLAVACGGSDDGDAGAGTGGGGEPLEITAATYSPPSYNDRYAGFETFMEEAKEASDGDLTFDWYDSGTLLQADQLVPGLTQGVVDVIFTTSFYISSTYPILGVYELPFVFEEYEDFRESLAFDSELRSFVNEQLREQNLVLVGTMPTSFQWIWTADTPITSPEDIEGLRIRVAGPLEGRTVEALGGSPVTMSSAEVYEALERGTIDGLISYIGTIPGRSLQEVIQYGTAAPFGSYSVDAYARADWFEGLPEDQQEALLEAGRAYTDEGTENMVQVREGEYLEAIESAGVDHRAGCRADRYLPGRRRRHYEQWRGTVIAGLIYRSLTWTNLKRILISTVQVSTAVLAIVAAAFVFTQVLVLARVPSTMADFVGGLELPPFVIMAAIMVALIALGCLVDAASLLLVVTPVLVPVVTPLGFDPLWFGVLLVMNLELAVITPPVGLNLFAMKSVAPEIPLSAIIRGVIPYIAIDFALLMVMIVVPGIATWLPSIVVG